MAFTKEPKHIKTNSNTLKDGTIKTYTYDNKKYNQTMKLNNILIICSCGKQIKKYSKQRHQRTKKHLKHLEQLNI